MAQHKKQPSILRIIIPVVVIGIGVLIAVSQIDFGSSSEKQTTNDDRIAQITPPIEETTPAELDESNTPTPDEQDQPTEPATDDESVPVVDEQPKPTPSLEPAQDKPTDNQRTSPTSPTSPTFPPLLTGLHFRPQPVTPLTSLGNLDDPNASTPLRIDFNPRGVGIGQITLRDHYKSTDKQPDNRYEMLEGTPDKRPPLSLRAVLIDNIWVDAQFRYDENGQVVHDLWRQTSPGVFEAVIANENDEPIATIHRVFTLGSVTGQITITQSVRNETSTPLNIRVEQWGPSDLPYVPGGYGDFRRIRFGYLDPRSTKSVLAHESKYLTRRNSVLKDIWKEDEKRFYAKQQPDPNLQTIWPNATNIDNQYTLAWVATTGRYFGFAVHPHLQDPTQATNKALNTVETVQFWVNADGQTRPVDFLEEQYIKGYVNLKLISPVRRIQPGETYDFDLGVFAGPLKRTVLASEQPYRSFNLKELVVYQLSCAWCTFQWLAHILLNFLRLIYGDVISIGGIGIGVHDWAIAIIILVFCVRVILHPLTKKGQGSMQRFSKKMGALQPELKKLQEKYRDNPKKLQSEQMKMYKEHNVNPAGCLGMAPMFLQMPIWVALYASLYFAIELRHQEAFYGLFQMFGNWSFLSDLARPDMFIDFGGPILMNVPILKSIPLLNTVTSINILPILMGLIFYLQQKYMTPPQANQTPEQATQQRIMKIMMVTMFPLMLYRAPAGLTMYIIASSTIGILESKHIRAHVDAMDLEKEKNPKPTKTPRKKVTNQAAGKSRTTSPKKSKTKRR